MARHHDGLRAALALVAPGTQLRDGLDRVVKAKRGALIVVGDGPAVLGICSGGFLLDAQFTPQKLAELAKMDGAIILAQDASRIARANVHLVPDPTVPTSETGTRHRTAERVARSLRVPVVSASEDMGTIGVYVGAAKHTLEDMPRLLARANQALQTLERYKLRLDDAAAALTALEVEDIVTLRDVATLLQRAETVRRIADEIEDTIVELGAEAPNVRLQLEELRGEHLDDHELVLRDYLPDVGSAAVGAARRDLEELTTDALLDPHRVAAVIDPGNGEDLDVAMTPRGYRLLAKVRLPDGVAGNLVSRFSDLPRLMRATLTDLDAVEGVDSDDAHAVKEGLSRLTEAAVLDQFR